MAERYTGDFWKTSGGVPLRFAGGGAGPDSSVDLEAHDAAKAVPTMPHEGFRELWKELIKESLREVLAENGRNGHG